MASSDLPHKPHPDAPPPESGKKTPRKDGRTRKVQDKLDDALADSFPASDPVSIVTSHAEEDWDTRESEDEKSSVEQAANVPGGGLARPDAPPPGSVPTGGH